jgi:hypothetical protein
MGCETPNLSGSMEIARVPTKKLTDIHSWMVQGPNKMPMVICESKLVPQWVGQCYFSGSIYIYSLVIPVYILISSWWISILPQLNTHICWWIPIVRWYCLRFNLNSYLLSFYIHICMAESSQRTPRRFFSPGLLSSPQWHGWQSVLEALQGDPIISWRQNCIVWRGSFKKRHVDQWFHVFFF